MSKNVNTHELENTLSLTHTHTQKNIDPIKGDVVYDTFQSVLQMENILKLVWIAIKTKMMMAWHGMVFVWTATDARMIFFGR